MRTGVPLLAVAALAIANAGALAQQKFDSVEVRTTLLSGGVYMLQGAGGNIGVAAGDDAVFVIDDQYAPLTPKVLAAIAAITSKPVRFVLNTHWHFDHVGGNENMGKAGALIVAHENVRRRMSTDQFMEAFDRHIPPAPPEALPVVTFTESVTFHINGDSVVVTHVPPAHTDGDAIVHFTKANVLHTGDLFVNRGFPFVDLSSGGSIDGIIGGARLMLEMTNAQTKIIPGHGPLGNRAQLQAYHDMLVALRDRARSAVAAAMTLEQFIAADITAPYASEWRTGRERFVRLLFQELNGR